MALLEKRRWELRRIRESRIDDPLGSGCIYRGSRIYTGVGERGIWTYRLVAAAVADPS